MSTETPVESDAKGEVRFFNTDRGFGFCRREKGVDVFVHASELKRSGILDGVQPGQRLSFDVVLVDGRGLQARNIQRHS